MLRGKFKDWDLEGELQVLSPRLKRQAEWFLVEASAYARSEGRTAVDLVTVASPRAVGLNNNYNYSRDIGRVAQVWEKASLGTLYYDGRPKFTFIERGHVVADPTQRRLTRRSFRQRLGDMNWDAVSAVAALVAAVAAIAAAYFSYLALPRH